MGDSDQLLDFPQSHCPKGQFQQNCLRFSSEANATMRLLTHNVLQCPRTRSYPLKLVAQETETVEVEYDRDFIEAMLPRVDWKVLRTTAHEVSCRRLTSPGIYL